MSNRLALISQDSHPFDRSEHVKVFAAEVINYKVKADGKEFPKKQPAYRSELWDRHPLSGGQGCRRSNEVTEPQKVETEALAEAQLGL